jgi:hypothetical protein
MSFKSGGDGGWDGNGFDTFAIKSNTKKSANQRVILCGSGGVRVDLQNLVKLGEF